MFVINRHLNSVEEAHQTPVDVARGNREHRSNEDRPASAADQRGDRHDDRARCDEDALILLVLAALEIVGDASPSEEVLVLVPCSVF
jgi:hypothetical protein